MSLKERVRDDLKSAMKGGDVFSLGVLRMVTAALNNKSIEKRGKGLPEELTEDEIIEIMGRESKKRQDAAGVYAQGGRADLAEKEKKEAAFIQVYLPAQMSREEIRKKVEEVITRLDTKDFGAIMKEAMKELKGKTDGKVVGEIIKEKIGS